jgi:RNA polymerase sigma-70 factor (family 1)
VRVREVAEELVSDVFYTIWKNRRRIQFTSPQSYLFTAVRNRGFDYLRKTRRTTWCDLDEACHIAADHPDSHDIMAECELSDSLQRSIAALPKKCRMIFEMSRAEGLKYREIALALNLSVKTVETQMGRALKRLHQSIPSV